MFSRIISSVAVLTLAATIVTAVPTGGDSQCNTGSIQCCDSTQSASDSVLDVLLHSLGIDVGSITGLVGVTCSPITVIGAGGTDCSQQPVCCENDSFNGVVALGCTPINLNA